MFQVDNVLRGGGGGRDIKAKIIKGNIMRNWKFQRNLGERGGSHQETLHVRRMKS